MANASLAAWLLPGLAGLLLGGLLAYAATRASLGRRIADLAIRLEQMQRARDQANELLMQARRQADLFNKELDLLRRQQVLNRIHAHAPAPAIPAVKLPVDARGEAASPVLNSGFKDTIINPRPPDGF